MALPQKKSDYRDTATRVTVTPRSKQIRNVERLGGTRINDDFAYLQQTPLPQNASNDEIFNADYQTRGLQPTTARNRIPKIEASNDDEYGEEDEENNLAEQDYYARGMAAAQQQHAKNVTQKAKLLRAKLSASRVNVSVFSWGTALWSGVQLPAALFSLITFAISGTINAFLSSSNILISAAAWIAEKSLAGIGLLFGFDIRLIEMSESLFLLTYVLVLALGFFTLMVIYLQYTMALLRPLSGEGAGLKMGMFILAIVGYSVPVFNLFPCALPWMWAVWKYPK